MMILAVHFVTRDFTKYDTSFDMLQHAFPFVENMAYPGHSTCEIVMNDTESLFDITLILLSIILTEQCTYIDRFNFLI